MQVCQDRRVKWAIFSDKYGVYFPDERHGYYEKSPSQVLEHEFVVLLESFDRKLRPFDEIWFYYPGRVNPLYRRLLSEARLRNRVKMFSHLKEIG